MLPEGTFEGKVAIVTGGGSGLGRAMALELGRLGAKVAVLGRRPVVPQHVAGGAVGRDGHAVLPARVRGPDEVVAEPVPLRLGQVLDETQDGGAAVDQYAAQLVIGQPVRLLQHAMPGE